MNLAIQIPKLLTADEFHDFVQLPENEPRTLELVRGEVIELPRPTRIHCVVCSNISFVLQLHARKRKTGYVATNDTGVVIDADTVRGPDVAYYDDVQAFDDLPEKWGDTPPRLVAEVLSPNDRADFVNTKITDYLDNGVEVVWLVDPSARTVTVYRADAGPQVVGEKGKLAGDPVLPGFRCKVADFFAMPGDKEKPKRPRGKPS